MAARPEIQILIKAMNEAKRPLEDVKQDIKNYTDAVINESRKTQASFKDVATSISGVVTAGFALYNIYDQIEQRQYAVSKATNTLEDSQRNQKDALAKLNKAIQEHGDASEEAIKAQEAYEAKCKDVELAQERLNIAQGNLNESLLKTATFAIPSVITFMDQGRDAYTSLKRAIDGATISQHGLNAAMYAAPIGIIAALLGIVAKSSWEYQQRVGALTEEQKQFFDASIKTMPELEHATSATYFTLLSKAEEYKTEITDSTYVDAVTRNAEKMKEEITKETQAMVDNINKEIETGLLGNAQNNFEEYTKCISGKQEGLASDVKSSYLGMTTDLAELSEKLTLGEETLRPKSGKVLAPPGLSELRDLPQGSYLLEHHSPLKIAPINETHTHTELNSAPVVNVHIHGPIQSGMLPAIGREVKRSTYEGTSEALRDLMRRRGIPIWRGYS